MKNKPLKLERIYFHLTAHQIKGVLYFAIKIGHSLYPLGRSGTYHAVIPTFDLIYSFEVPDQTLDARKNKKIAYELEQRILSKFKHLNIAPHIKDCEVVIDNNEIRKFIKDLKWVEKSKNPQIKKAALNRLFVPSISVSLEVDDKPTNYSIDLVTGQIFSSIKMKEPDCEGRIQLDLDYATFGKYKHVLNKTARQNLLDEHRAKHNYNGIRS